MSASSGGGSRVPLPDSTVYLGGAERMGPLGDSRDLEVDVYLRRPASAAPLPPPADLEAPISRAAFVEQYSADPDDMRSVEAFARGAGLAVIGVDPVCRRISLAGNAGRVERAFGVQLAEYEDAGVRFFAYAGPILLPEDVMPLVVGVLGLDDRPIEREQGVEPADGVQTKAVFPQQVAKAYGFPHSTGRGVSVGIIGLNEGYEQKVLDTYWKQAIQRRGPTVDQVRLGGAKPPKPGDGETFLDLEVLGCIVPEATLVVYSSAKATKKWYARAVCQAIHDEHRNAVISSSWYWPEPPCLTMDVKQLNVLLHEAACLGIPFCVASGDSGSQGGGPITPSGHAQVVFPASSEFALSCGGTMELESGTGAAEVVWNLGGQASGGGVSRLFAPPRYQTQAGLEPRSVNPKHRAGRGVPDVAGRAVFYRVNLGSGMTTQGGTSAVAPLWAALIAMMTTETVGGRVGFLNPRLYGLRGRGFHDVTRGNNEVPGVKDKYFYKATAGWDACTGWGSPHGAKLVRLLEPYPPPSASS